MEVFARASNPETKKLRIVVGALRYNGEIVAMTGTVGTDAISALKQADIGIALARG
jgi:magnesium-transporting ATPase (P-type)